MNTEELAATLKRKGFPEYIVKAFQNVKREKFLPDHLIPYAYEDMTLPLAEGSTVSQPSTLAFMLELLHIDENQKILEIGSGSGYSLALLSNLSPKGEVYGIELLERVAVEAKKRLTDYPNIKVLQRDGAQGLPEQSPFHRILVSASCPSMDIVYKLLDQLLPNGIIVAAVRENIVQIIKHDSYVEKNEFPGFLFVPLVTDKK